MRHNKRAAKKNIELPTSIPVKIDGDINLVAIFQLMTCRKCIRKFEIQQ